MDRKKPFLVNQLTVNYESTIALWDLSFEIPKEGFITAIVGPNGAGKSTLLKTAMGHIKPVSGKILFFESQLEKNIKSVAYIPQRETIDWDFPISVFDTALMGSFGRLKIFGRPTAEDRKKTLDVLKMLNLDHLAKRQIRELSGGEQQKLFIARAFIQDPEIFLLDEPFKGIDLSTELFIMDLFKKLKKNNKTIICIHHDLNTIKSYFDWIIFLNRSLICAGSVDDVFTNENIFKCFGRKNFFLFDEAQKLSSEKTSGLK